MILYHVDSNSIWVECTKNKTEGEMILARGRALIRMKACGIMPKRQVLDNEASAAINRRSKIQEWSTNSYHQTTTVATSPRKQFKLGKIILLQLSAEPLPTSHFISGVKRFHRWKGNSISFANQTPIPKYPPTLISMATMTTMPYHSCQLELSQWHMIDQTNVKPLPNITAKAGS